ncbi:hypothetical protein WJX81_005153 [Elliptochloris bilobata]|uniref:Uncharacterized protein n=1 Tax=Elliptochloris bilobata TaxID=381761 RepID=A0AAW1QWI8_9CHLO
MPFSNALAPPITPALSPQLKDRVSAVLDHPNKTPVYIIGVSHVGCEAAADVQAVVLDLGPRFVVLEVDQLRHKALERARRADKTGELQQGFWQVLWLVLRARAAEHRQALHYAVTAAVLREPPACAIAAAAEAAQEVGAEMILAERPWRPEGALANLSLSRRLRQLTTPKTHGGSLQPWEARAQGGTMANLGAVGDSGGAPYLQEAVLEDPSDALARLLQPPGQAGAMRSRAEAEGVLEGAQDVAPAVQDALSSAAWARAGAPEVARKVEELARPFRGEGTQNRGPLLVAAAAGLGLGYLSYHRPRAVLGLTGIAASAVAPIVYFQASEMPVVAAKAMMQSFSPGITQLSATCLIMFGGALGAGLLPGMLSVTESQLGAISALGAGLLVGTALAVVLPEGFEALHAVHESAGHGAAEMPEWAAGAVLVGGFLAMLILDQAQRAAVGRHAHGNGGSAPCCIAPGPTLSHRRTSDEGLRLSAAEAGSPARMLQGKMDGASRALVGLLVHSAADGFAVGAACVGGSSALSSAVALAMVLHKAPVAFGLATYLAAARWQKPRARRALVLFAAASPMAAVVTFGLLAAAPALSSEAGIALCVLFSGGTFLYASCIHILPEVMAQIAGMTLQQVAAVVIGSLVPLVGNALQGPHHH